MKVNCFKHTFLGKSHSRSHRINRSITAKMQKILPATRPQWYNLKMKEMSKHSEQSGIEVKKTKIHTINKSAGEMWSVAFDLNTS